MVSIAVRLHEEADKAEHLEYHQRCQVVWDNMLIEGPILNDNFISRIQLQMDRIHKECSDKLGRRLRRMTASIEGNTLHISIEPYTPSIFLTMVIRHDFNC